MNHELATAERGDGVGQPLQLAGAALCLCIALGAATTAAAGPGGLPDWHVVYAEARTWRTDENSGYSYSKNSAREDANNRSPYDFGAGGAAMAYATLNTGKICVNAMALPSGTLGVNAFAGAAWADTTIGARIFLTGPSQVAGIAKITMNVPGVFSNPSTLGAGYYTYSSQLMVTAQTGQSNGQLGFAGGVALMSFGGGEGKTYGLDCVSCSIKNGRPLPATLTSSIPFAAGQKYIDYIASLHTFAYGAASVSMTSPATFSIVLPPGFTHTSTLKISGP